jgi:hypothetical protein
MHPGHYEQASQQRVVRDTGCRGQLPAFVDGNGLGLAH